MTPRGRLNLAASALLELVWPSACLVCDVPTPPGEPLCPDCDAKLTTDPGEKCPRCATDVGPFTDLSLGCPRCRNAGLHFAGATRLGLYAGALRDAVLRMKDQSGELLAGHLGERFARVRQGELSRDHPQIVVPVPLHWRRRWGRGYNQAEEVARGLARGLALPCWPRCLARTRPTPSQATQSPTERRANLKGAFRARPSHPVRGLRVLLVDDVLTTGATADAASVALLEAGAAQVHLAALAHR